MHLKKHATKACFFIGSDSKLNFSYFIILCYNDRDIFPQMLSKIYFHLKDVIQELEANLSAVIQKRITANDSSRLFYFSTIYFNLKLVSFEIISDVIKFLVVVFADPSQGFRLFYNQRDLQACPYSYTGFRQVQKKVRIFSLAGISIILSVSVITSLITNIIFCGKLPGKAATFGWQQLDWAVLSTDYAKHKNPNNQQGWDKYAGIDNGFAATSSGQFLQLSLVSASTTKRSSNGNADSPASPGAGFDAGATKNNVITVNDKIQLATEINNSNTYTTSYNVGIAPISAAFDSRTNSLWVGDNNGIIKSINIITGQVTSTSTIATCAYEMLFENFTNSLWSICMSDNRMTKLNVLTGTSTMYNIGQWPESLTFDNLSQSIWVVNRAGVPSVTKYNPSTAAVMTLHPVDGLSNYAGIAFDEITNSVWVTKRNVSLASKINVNTAASSSFSTGAWPSSVAFDLLGRSVWVVNRSGSSVTRINIDTGTTSSVAVGLVPTEATVENVTNSTWVTNQASNAVTKINRNTGTTTTFAVDAGPVSAAFDSVTNSLWVANNSSNTVSKIPVVVYKNSGIYESAPIDLGATVYLTTFEYSSSTPANTSLAMDLRAGDTATPDLSWTGWQINKLSGDSIASLGAHKYVQYRMRASTTDVMVTPVLNSVKINYQRYLASSSLTSSWYDTTDAKNTVTRISWQEDVSMPIGATAKVQLRTAAASSTNSASPDTPTAWMGPNDSTSEYFSSSTPGCTKSLTGIVSCLISPDTFLGDALSDQWMQYRVTLESGGNLTPTVDNFNIQYVVNNPPEFQTDSFVSSQSTTTGNVDLTFAVFDSDTDSGTNHPFSVGISLEYWDGAGWVSASSSLLAFNTGTSSVAVSSTTYNNYSLSWDIKNEPALAAQFIPSLELRLVANDGEFANSLGFATTSVRVDTKSPLIGPSAQPLVIDSRLAATQPAAVQFDQLDDSPLYYKLGRDTDMTGVSEWLPYVSTTSLDIRDLGTSSIYAIFKDEYGNFSPVFHIVLTETPINAIIRDLTNADVGKYMEFIAWQAIAAYNGAFKTYQVWRGESPDANEPTDYQLIGTTTLNQVSKNYFLDENVVPGSTYFYKVAAEDMNGNISMFSPVLKDNPDGQGGTDNTPPAISNIEIVASSTQSVTIAWDTDELSSSYVGYSKAAGDFSTVVGYDTMVDKAVADGGTMGRHQVTISGLTASTTYYFQVKSLDPGSNLGTQDKDARNNDTDLSFTTNPGPQISEVNIDYTQLTNTTVAVKWLTDLDSDSVVVYSVNPDMVSPAEIQGLTGTTTNHEVRLENLLPRTVYYFYVKSSRVVDGQIEEAYDKNVDPQGIIQYYKFETTYDQEAPAISEPTCQLTLTAGSTTPALIISATTSEPATIHFSYGLATSTFDAEQATTTNFNINQVVLIDNLLASTTYYFKITAIDKSGNARTNDNLFCSTGEQLATQAELQKAYKAGQDKGTQEGQAEGRAQQAGGGVITVLIDKTDKAAPEIANLRLSALAATTTDINWVTNELSDTFVSYSANGSVFNYGEWQLTANHSAHLRNLLPKTDYTYQVASRDSSGNLSVSSLGRFTTPDLSKAEVELAASTTAAETKADKEELVKTVIQKAMSIFETMAGQISLGSLETSVIANYNTLDKLAQLIPAPVLGGEPATEITPTTVTISWNTDKPANSMVAYAPEGLYSPSKGSRGYLQLVGEPNQYMTDHSIKIVGLKPDSVYHYQLRSKAKIGIEASSRDFVFRTKPEALEIISVNTETLAKDKAKFNWLTSQETNTELTYTPYRNGKLSTDELKIYREKTLTTSHEAIISDLEAGVVYQFQIGATDKKGLSINKTISFFSTTKDDLPPEITDIQTESALSQSKDAKVQTIMTWTTSEPTISRIKFAKGVFDEAEQLNEETPMETVYTRKHTIVVTKFEIGEVYTFRVLAEDSGGNQTVSSPHIVLTPKQKEGVFELIINTFESTFGWLGQMK